MLLLQDLAAFAAFAAFPPSVSCFLPALHFALPSELLSELLQPHHFPVRGPVGPDTLSGAERLVCPVEAPPWVCLLLFLVRLPPSVWLRLTRFSPP